MRRLGLERDIVDRDVRDRAADRCRSLGVTLPTFAQLAEPDLIPADVQDRLATVDPGAADPLNLFRAHWFNDATGAGRVDVPEHLVLPPELTGVGVADRHRPGQPLPDDRVAQGHRRLRVPRAADRDRAVRPRDPAGHLALHRQLLPRRRGDLADHGLPGRRGPPDGDEPGAVRVARALGRGPVGHHPHAGHREQRQGDLRPLRGAGPRAGHGDLQPVQRVREPRRPLRAHGPRPGARVRARRGVPAGSPRGGLRLGHRVRRHDRRR